MSVPISVLIPCFNVEEYLSEALESILRQSYQNLIVLVLDDGSTDNTLDIAQQFSAKDERVKIHRNIENLGIIASRNKLLELCDTDIAAWMDADDIAEPNRIEQQIGFLNSHPEYVNCTCHYYKKNKQHTKLIAVSESYLSPEYLLFYNYVFNPGSMFRVDICRINNIKFRTWISGASDYLFWVELSKFGKIGLVEEPLMVYREHSGQETIAHKYRQNQGCLENVQSQLKAFDCEAETEVLARMLVYPAQKLSLNFTLVHMRRSASIIKTILQALPKSNYNQEQVRLLLMGMFRRQAWRNGLMGVMLFVKLFGFEGLKNSRNFGFDLLKQAIAFDYRRVKHFFKK
ncbi:glycosyltransferase family 2 protein [Aliiglaciecola sp. 2_MG-2023]|uniref:glycosyltransferase family 2 protein n=1 Tax=unclassified Aliiglaciecola TaxID=2593648 RepID=UPI0026E44AD4|nr:MULTISPECIES: glycosyltransferase family 2 protein [unclassified Aliiglaciecola]MDO6709367.1 glycosyltransferase family 2 protein [Aliiglaciecola sp. 2_MG-2023]MDO6750515.1 glycosyltransferase family 2 protein [Aliiglaciecola sp. 1_MG-2023]